MENSTLITLETIIEHYNVDREFIDALCEYGLVHLVDEAETQCIEREKLGEFERMIRLHYDLEINLAGIDAIYNLLRRIEDLQTEVNALKNRLADR